MGDGWRGLGERTVPVRVPVGVELWIRREGAKWRARAEVGLVRIDYVSLSRRKAIDKVLEHASMALGRALRVA